MTLLFRTLFKSIASSLLFWCGSAHAQTDMTACYGDMVQLELTLQLDNSNSLPVSLPSDTDLIVKFVDQEEVHILSEIDCLKEPIQALRVSAMFQGRYQKLDLTGESRESPAIFFLQLGRTNPMRAFAVEQFAKFIIKISGSERQEGYFHVPIDGEDPLASLWLFPSGDLSPIGTAKFVFCEYACLVGYRLARDIEFGYIVVVDEDEVAPDWASIDRVVLPAALKWFGIQRLVDAN